MKHNIGDLYQMQALPLQAKITMTIVRVRGWLDHWDDNCYISFSGGKDSTVLVDIIHNKMGRKDIPLVYVDTGLEYPEIREFVKSYGDRVIQLKPQMNFRQVIEKYGYPMISKQISKRVWEWNNAKAKGKDLTQTEAYKEFTGTRYVLREGYDTPMKSFHNKEKWMFLTKAPFKMSHKCCDIMKKKSLKKMHPRKAITAQMACESINRQKSWLIHGCNAFDAKEPISNPMSFWTEQDVLEYIKTFKIPICSVYGEVVPDYDATDDLEGQMRFDDLTPDLWSDELKQPRLKTTGCNRTGCMFCGFGCHLEKSEGRFERMKRTHPKQYEWIMKPWDEGGLGYKEVIDWINEHGKLNIKY